MKTKLTILWAGATLALAIANVPTAAGQEKAIIKTGRIASVPEQNVQLRADEEEELPDSIIVYSPDGEKITKYTYLPGESFGQSGYYYYLGIYDRESNVQSMKVSYKIHDDGYPLFYYPLINAYYNYWSIHVPDFSTNYDANGNLTSFSFLYGDGRWYEYAVTYNAKNRPVSIEGKGSDGLLTFKAHYEYNEYGYCTLFDSYNRDYERQAWESAWKETARYDAQGKLLYKDQSGYGKMIHTISHEYYDENHYSLTLWTLYDDNGNPRTDRYEWKYNTDGKPEAYYRYENDELSEYAILYYPDPSGNIPVSAGSNVWSSGRQLYIAATANGAAQVYAVSGQLLKTVALTAGQTVALPLPRGLYIVATGGKTWKVIL